MTLYIHVNKRKKRSEEPPDTVRRPELAEAWATIMNSYCEKIAIDPLTAGNTDRRVDCNED